MIPDDWSFLDNEESIHVSCRTTTAGKEPGAKDCTSLLEVNIDRTELQFKSHPENGGSAKIRDAKCLGTYNYVGQKNDVILIPGAPPVWLPNFGGLGSAIRYHYHTDRKLDTCPIHPLETVIQAAGQISTGFDIDDYHLVADALVIDYLLSFILSLSDGFILDVEVLRETVLISSQESEFDRWIYPHQKHILSYGVVWEECARGFLSHQRVISYSFGGLQVLLRSTCHGYVPEDTDLSEIFKEKEAIQMPDSRLSLQENHEQTVGHLTIHHDGKLIPQEAVLDINITLSDDITPTNDYFRRLWSIQVSKAVILNKDCSSKISKVKDVARDINQWEEENESNLRALAGLLREIIGVARRSASKKLSIASRGGTLQIKELAEPPTIFPIFTGDNIEPLLHQDAEAVQDWRKDLADQAAVPRRALRDVSPLTEWEEVDDAESG